MKRPSPSRRRGNIVVLSAVLIVAMMAMLAFAVDLGYIAAARTELQRSADAAALAAANQLPSLSNATLAASACAQDNQTSITPTLKPTDLVFGYWNRDTATFSNPKPLGRPYNAVRVTLRRTAANGNALELFFGRVLGKNTTDVTASAIGYGDRGLCGPFVGIEWVKASGNLLTDSFDSWEGSYRAAYARDRGSLCSDGEITVGGDAHVRGDVRAGRNQVVTISGSSVDITGEIGNRLTPLNLPPVDASSAQGNNNNSSLSRYRDPDGTGWIDPINQQGDFHLTGGASFDLPPGTYYFRNMTMLGGSTLNITGKTTIYMTGDLKREGGASVNNNTQLASNLSIKMTGGTASISSNNVFYGVIYGPNTDINYSGTADFFGAIVGKTLTISGDATAHYDEALDLDLGAYAIRTMLVD
jgi:Flp pilus assembly protein TadG